MSHLNLLDLYGQWTRRTACRFPWRAARNGGLELPILTWILVGFVTCLCCVTAPAGAQIASATSEAGTKAAVAPPRLGPLELLGRPDIQKELDLLDEQLLQLHHLRLEVETARRDRLQKLLEQLRAGSIDRTASLNAIRQELAGTDQVVTDRLTSILLPHQARRLAQIQLQQQLRQGGLQGATWLAELAISAEQQAAIRQAAEASERELQRKAAETRTALQREILKLLTPLQKQKLQDLVGKPFQFQDHLPARSSGEPTPAVRPPSASGTQ